MGGRGLILGERKISFFGSYFNQLFLDMLYNEVSKGRGVVCLV